jgi:hypothetical protein
MKISIAVVIWMVLMITNLTVYRKYYISLFLYYTLLYIFIGSVLVYKNDNTALMYRRISSVVCSVFIILFLTLFGIEVSNNYQSVILFSSYLFELKWYMAYLCLTFWQYIVFALIVSVNFVRILLTKYKYAIKN